MVFAGVFITWLCMVSVLPFHNVMRLQELPVCCMAAEQRRPIIKFSGHLGHFTWNQIITQLVIVTDKTPTAAPVAEGLRTLIFSALNRSLSPRCGFEPSSGHMRDKQSSACGWSGGISRGSLVFAPPSIGLAQNVWNNHNININKKKRETRRKIDNETSVKFINTKTCKYVWSKMSFCRNYLTKVIIAYLQ